MEAEMFSRANMLLFQGRIEEANHIACWLYAYWRLKGVELWRSVYQASCMDKDIDNLLKGYDVEKTVRLMEIEFSDNPSVELFAKLGLAKTLTGRDVWIDEKALSRLAKDVGFDELVMLTGEISLTNVRIGTEKPWLIMAQIPRFREVVKEWLSKVAL